MKRVSDMTPLEKDYVLGLNRLPPSIMSKPQKTYVYGGDIAVANGSSARLDIPLDADSDFLVEGIEVLSSLQTALGDAITIQISDTTYSQPWSNVAVPMRDLAGLGSLSHELKYPNMMAPTGTLSLNITNSSGTNCQVYVALHGRKFYNVTPAERAFLKQRMWYQYVMQVPSLADSSTGNQVNMQIFNESDFLLYRMTSWQAWKYIMADTIGAVSGEIKCNFRDTSSDRNFFNQNLALRLVVGSTWALNIQGGAYVPQSGDLTRFVKPLFIRRNGLIQGTFDNLSTNGAAGTGAFSVIFEGARVFTPTDN